MIDATTQNMLLTRRFSGKTEPFEHIISYRDSSPFCIRYGGIEDRCPSIDPDQ
jgi:hypothetical protein